MGSLVQVQRRAAPKSRAQPALARSSQADPLRAGSWNQDVHSDPLVDPLASAARGVRGSGSSLPHEQTIQRAFGRHDVSGVRAHTDAAAAQANGEIGANAYATGNDVAFSSSSPSLRTTAHEAAHTVQQTAGVRLESGIGKSGDAYEAHADAVADAVVSGKSAENLLNRPPSGTATSSNPSVQRDLDSVGGQHDPVEDLTTGDQVDPAHVNDLLYGLTSYRGATTDRLKAKAGNDAAKMRTIDEYNAEVGINGMIINSALASVGLYMVRPALKNPDDWKTHLSTSKHDYPSQQAINDFEDGTADTLTNEQKWMTFLVRQREKIGLFDLGDKTRPVIGKNMFGFKKKGEARGLSKIKDKGRFEKNMGNADADTFTESDVHKMLSFGVDRKAARKYYDKQPIPKQVPMNRWIQNAFWRRTSKLGIDFAVSSKGLNSEVHFNLASAVKNGNKWEAVGWGVLDDVAQDKGTRKITESEWRHAKKMIKNDPALANKIHAYSEFKD